jgi:hypothetical protein
MVGTFRFGACLSVVVITLCAPIAIAQQEDVVSETPLMVAVGACCDTATATCTPDVAEGDCQGMNQNWFEGVTCAAADCGSPLGACCFKSTNGIELCNNLPESLCAIIGDQSEPREWQGGKICAVNNQSCPFISCLEREGRCFEPHATAGCNDAFCCSAVCRLPFQDFCCVFEWDFVCVQVANGLTACDIGACCGLSTGTCVDDVASSDCSATTDAYTRAQACSSITCEPTFGACCDRTAGGGAVCSDNVFQDDCMAANLEFTAGEICANAGCTEFTGSCCDLRDGTCADGIELDNCSDPAQRWLQSTTCDIASCSPESAACCDRLHGTCTSATFAACSCNDCEWLVGQRCEDVVCEAGFLPIPTTSQWGLAVLTLLLLCAAKIAFARPTEATT